MDGFHIAFPLGVVQVRRPGYGDKGPLHGIGELGAAIAFKAVVCGEPGLTLNIFLQQLKVVPGKRDAGMCETLRLQRA
jgi:hypothetical protein